jgi:hypothetical protein
MVWVRFTEDFRYKPKPAVTQFFPKGTETNVTRGCADKALTSGKAIAVERGKKARADGLGKSQD